MNVRDEAAVQAALHRAEQTLHKVGTLKGTGFWSAVSYLRRDRGAAERLGGLAASIDRMAFESAVRLRVPASIGIAGLAVMTVSGVVAVLLSSQLGDWAGDIAFLVGLGALEVGTHSLTHWAFGRSVGIKFTHVFLGGPPPPRPGVKIDYASYLSVSPLLRAMMHASGAVVTKIIPFALVPVAKATRVSEWVIWILLVVGSGQILTDLLFSTKTSDWKKVRRELAIARQLTKS